MEMKTADKVSHLEKCLSKSHDEKLAKIVKVAKAINSPKLNEEQRKKIISAVDSAYSKVSKSIKKEVEKKEQAEKKAATKKKAVIVKRKKSTLTRAAKKTTPTKRARVIKKKRNVGYTYIPNDKILSLEAIKNSGNTVNIKASNILDGAYVKKGSYGFGGMTDAMTFNNDYNRFVDHIKNGAGYIDKDYVEYTWSNISSIPYIHVKEHLLKRLSEDNMIKDIYGHKYAKGGKVGGGGGVGIDYNKFLKAKTDKYRKEGYDLIDAIDTAFRDLGLETDGKFEKHQFDKVVASNPNVKKAWANYKKDSSIYVKDGYYVNPYQTQYAKGGLMHKYKKARSRVSAYIRKTKPKVKKAAGYVKEKYGKAAEYSKSKYKQASDSVNEKIKNAQKATALKVIDKTKDKVSNDQKMHLKAAQEIIKNKYEDGGGLFGSRKYPTGAAWAKEHKYKSKESHEKKYKRKTNPKNTVYRKVKS